VYPITPFPPIGQSPSQFPEQHVLVTAPFSKHLFPATSQVAVVAAGVVVPVEVEGAVEVEGVVTQTPEEHSKPEAESQAPAQLVAELSPQVAPAASL